MVKSSTVSGHLDILRNAIEKTVDSQIYPLVEASSGQEQYYIRSALHLLICCSAVEQVSHALECKRYEFWEIEQFM